MKKVTVLLWGALVSLVLLSACSGGTGSVDKPTTSERARQEVGALLDDMTQIVQEIQSDPGIMALGEIFGTFEPPTTVYSFSKPALQSLQNPFQITSMIMPMISVTQQLPRGGIDQTVSPAAEFDPQPPVDFELIWPTRSGKVGDLQIDWDRRPTVNVETQDGALAERPTHSAAALFLGDGVSADHRVLGAMKVGRGELQASWYSCGGTPIDEPTRFALDTEAGQRSKLGVSLQYQLSEGATDRYTLKFEATGSASSGTLREWVSLTAYGKTTRNIHCWPVDFQIDRGNVNLGVRTRTSSGSRSLEFDANLSGFVFGEYEQLKSVDVSGSLKVNGAVAATFAGTLDDLQSNCPGRHVTVKFSDRTESLSDWLRESGFCSPSVY